MRTLTVRRTERWLRRTDSLLAGAQAVAVCGGGGWWRDRIRCRRPDDGLVASQWR